MDKFPEDFNRAALTAIEDPQGTNAVTLDVFNASTQMQLGDPQVEPQNLVLLERRIRENIFRVVTKARREYKRQVLFVILSDGSVVAGTTELIGVRNADSMAHPGVEDSEEWVSIMTKLIYELDARFKENFKVVYGGGDICVITFSPPAAAGAANAV